MSSDVGPVQPDDRKRPDVGTVAQRRREALEPGRPPALELSAPPDLPGEKIALEPGREEAAMPKWRVTLTDGKPEVTADKIVEKPKEAPLFVDFVRDTDSVVVRRFRVQDVHEIELIDG